MRDITVMLVGYSDLSTLSQAIRSLHSIRDRIQEVIIFDEDEYQHVAGSEGIKQISFMSTSNRDEGELLQESMGSVKTTYVLWLSSNDYLTNSITSMSLQLQADKSVLVTDKHQRHITIQKPLLVRTSCVQERPLALSSELPFQEALLSAWLMQIPATERDRKDSLLKNARINRYRGTMEKYRFLKKYEHKSTSKDTPSLTIVIAAFNAEAYIQTTVASCLLQTAPVKQILIMDDGSTDHTYKRLERYQAYARVQVFQQQNGGKARALNQLLPYVTADFILELDADDWLDPDAIDVIKTKLADVSEDVSVLYGNMRLWKQHRGSIQFKEVAKGRPVQNRKDLLSYRFPLGPRIYRTSILKKQGGFPVITFADGRLFEDVSVLDRLIQYYPFQYSDFTVYNVRQHTESITSQHSGRWQEFLESLE